MRPARRDTLPTHERSAAPAAPGFGARLKRLGEARLGLLPSRRLRDLAAEGPSQAAMRALATAVPLAGDPPLLLCRVLGRCKLLVAAADLTQAPHLILDGYWKWWVTAFLSRNLASGQRIVDAGAGYGYFSLLAAELVGPTGHVLVVEAHPMLAGLLRRNLALNGMSDRSTVIAGALGTDAMPCWIAAPPDSPTAARLLPRGAETEEHGAPKRIATTPAPALDALTPEGADWVLLDLNGAEPEAWAGMQDLLARCPGIGVILSFDPARLVSAPAWLGLLGARFPLRRIDHDGVARPIRAEQVPPRGETTLCLMQAAPR